MKDAYIKLVLRISGLSILLVELAIVFVASTRSTLYAVSANGVLSRPSLGTPIMIIVGLLGLLLLLCNFAAGYGLITIRPWSRVFAICVLGVTIFLRIINHFAGYTTNVVYQQGQSKIILNILPFIRGLLSVRDLLTVAIIFFLMSKLVRDYYNKLYPTVTEHLKHGDAS